MNENKTAISNYTVAKIIWCLSLPMPVLMFFYTRGLLMIVAGIIMFTLIIIGAKIYMKENKLNYDLADLKERFKRIKIVSIVSWSLTALLLVIVIIFGNKKTTENPYLDTFVLLAGILLGLMTLAFAITFTIIAYGMDHRLKNGVLKPTQPTESTIVSSYNKLEKDHRWAAIISFITAVIPIVLIMCAIVDAIKKPHSVASGLALWLYYGTIGFPLLVISIICGIAGIKSSKKVLACIGLILAVLPIVFLIFLYITH